MSDVIYNISSGFFDSVNGDRLYSAADMNKPYKRVIADGIFPTPQGTPSTDFQVVAVSGMSVAVLAGNAMIGARWAENTDDVGITIAGNSSSSPRIDSIFLHIDTGMDTRAAGVVYRQGTAAGTPTAPAMVQTDNITELRLADILVAPSAAIITQANITDQRGGSDCPWVAGLIQQVDTSALFDQYRAAYAEQQQEQTDEWKTFMDHLARDYDISMSLRKHESTYTSTAAASLIPINIDGYDTTKDLLQVYINGIFAVEGTHYIVKSAAQIQLTNAISAGQKVHFVIYKAVMGGAQPIIPTDEQVQDAVDAYMDAHPGALVVDPELSDTSTHAIQNKAVAEALAGVNCRLHELGNSVDNAMVYINEGQATPTFTLFDGYIKKTGALQETDTSKATDFIPIYGNIAKRIEHTFTRGLSGVGYAFYDESKTYITDSWSNDYGNGVISVIPDTARYFRITQNPISAETKTVTIIYNDNNETIERIERKVDAVPTFHKQEYVPHPAESELYDFIVVPEGAEEICMEEFDSLDSGNFRITLSGSASAVSSDGYLVFTTVNGETGQAIAEYAELVDTSKNIRYSLLFNYVTTNTSQLRVFDIGKGKFYLFLNKTNKLRIVVLDAEGAVKYIDQSGAVVDSAYDFNISVNTEYILEVIIADGKIKAKMYNPTDGSVILDTETPLSELTSLDGGLVRFGKIATTASTAVNYKVGWFQHDVVEG